MILGKLLFQVKYSPNRHDSARQKWHWSESTLKQDIALKDIPFPWPIARIVREHHEKLDGSGYPQGLKGEEILEESQILAIADIIESMASFRPYRPALGIHAALQELHRCAGTQLDSQIVKICDSLYSRNPRIFELN